MDPYSFILYVSQATDALDQSAQIALREKAILNAHIKDITGVLVYRKGFFMQYIEGQEQAVHELFSKLRGNDRHFNVRILSQGAVEARLFFDWTIRRVLGENPRPSSQSLIDLFETVLSSKQTSVNEVNAVLKRFWKNSEVLEINA